MKRLIFSIFLVLTLTVFAKSGAADEKSHIAGIDLDSPIVPGTDFIASRDFTFPADSNEIVLWVVNKRPLGYKTCKLGYVQKPGDVGTQIVIPAHKHLKVGDITQNKGQCWQNNENGSYTEGVNDVVKYELSGASREVYLSCENHQPARSMVDISCNGSIISGRLSYREVMSKQNGIGIGFGIQYSAPKPPIPKKLPISYESGTQDAKIIDGPVKAKVAPSLSVPSEKPIIPVEGRSAI